MAPQEGLTRETLSARVVPTREDTCREGKLATLDASAGQEQAIQEVRRAADSPTRVDNFNDTRLEQARVSRHDLRMMNEGRGGNQAIRRVFDRDGEACGCDRDVAREHGLLDPRPSTLARNSSGLTCIFTQLHWIKRLNSQNTTALVHSRSAASARLARAAARRPRVGTPSSTQIRACVSSYNHIRQRVPPDPDRTDDVATNFDRSPHRSDNLLGPVYQRHNARHRFPALGDDHSLPGLATLSSTSRHVALNSAALIVFIMTTWMTIIAVVPLCGHRRPTLCRNGPCGSTITCLPGGNASQRADVAHGERQRSYSVGPSTSSRTIPVTPSASSRP